jgi:hypothetical protein
MTNHSQNFDYILTSPTKCHIHNYLIVSVIVLLALLLSQRLDIRFNKSKNRHPLITCHKSHLKIPSRAIFVLVDLFVVYCDGSFKKFSNYQNIMVLI